MHTKLELFLSHDGESWVAYGLSHQISVKNLSEFDNKIRKAITNDLSICDYPVDVTLHFDMDVFPKWLHQYQSHYFNHHFTIHKN